MISRIMVIDCAGMRFRLAMLWPSLTEIGMLILCTPALIGVLHAAQIGRQRLHDQARDLQALLHHLGRVRQLRDHARRHEAADLDLLHAGGGDRRDPAHLRLRGHARLGDLQSVARADFADGDVFDHG